MSHAVPVSRLSSLGIAVLLLLFMAAVLLGQDGKPPAAAKPLTPTEVQSLRLQVKHKDAELAFMNMQVAQQHYNAAMAELAAEGEKVKVENSWPHDTQFSPNDLTFAPAPPPTPTIPTSGLPVVPAAKETKKP